MTVQANVTLTYYSFRARENHLCQRKVVISDFLMNPKCGGLTDVKRKRVAAQAAVT